jgi:GT2 family glycosyltransferase
MQITLCVPTLNRYDDCKKMIQSATKGTISPTTAIIVDQGGTFPFHDMHFTIPIGGTSPGRNIGVAAAWNFMIQAAVESDAEYIICANDDVTFHENTVELLYEALLSGAVFAYPGEANRAGNTMNAFSLFMARPSLFERIGPFDENFWPAYFEDNDYAYRMKLQGLELTAAPCSYEHIGSATRKSLSEQDRTQHDHSFRVIRGYYRAKWGGLPSNEIFTTPFNGAPEAEIPSLVKAAYG